MLHTDQHSQGYRLADELERAGVQHGMTAMGVQTSNTRVDQEGRLFFCEMSPVRVQGISGTFDGGKMPNIVKLTQRQQAPTPGYYRASFDVTRINGAIEVTNLTLTPQLAHA